MPNVGLLNFLFGSILTVTVRDIITIAIVAVIVAIIVRIVYAKLLLTSFDESVAVTAGINVKRINMVFAVLTALVVVMGMTVVGILLISALMIVPVAAHLWGRGFKGTFLIAELYSLLGVIGGLVIAFFMDMPPGGTVVLVTVIAYAITFAITDLAESWWESSVKHFSL